MRNSTWVVVAVATAIAVGCSSSESDNQQSAGGGGGGVNKGYEPTRNGVPIQEHDACVALVDALQTSAERLRCVLTMPSCDAFIRSSGAPACVLYDQGSIQGCAQYYGSYGSCSDFSEKPCLFYYFEGTQPAGCPDAGASDSGKDAADDTAQEEAASDAGTESSTEDGSADARGDAGGADAAGE